MSLEVEFQVLEDDRGSAPMTTYLARKLSGCCTRCGVELGPHDDTNLCEQHRQDLCARVAASKAKRRARRATPSTAGIRACVGRPPGLLPVSTERAA